MSLIVDGRPSVSNETEQEGLPLLLPLVEIHTIGAGGGSLAWLEAGALRVGPQSAGADPGPACYGRGGTEPTVTDANVFLGRIGAESRLGGWMDLDHEAAAAAIHRIATQLGMDDVALAEGMLAIINAKMADAIRTITIQRGIDRQFTMVATAVPARCTRPGWPRSWASRRSWFRGAGDFFGMGHAPDRHPPGSRRSFFQAVDTVTAADVGAAYGCWRARGGRSSPTRTYPRSMSSPNARRTCGTWVGVLRDSAGGGRYRSRSTQGALPRHPPGAIRPRYGERACGVRQSAACRSREPRPQHARVRASLGRAGPVSRRGTSSSTVHRYRRKS